MNWILVALVIAGASSIALEDISEDAVQALFAFVGGCLWLLPPALTLRALKPSSGKRVRIAAYIGNTVPIIGFVLVPQLLAVSESGLAANLAGLAVGAAPFAFNIWGLRRVKGAEHAETVKGHEPGLPVQERASSSPSVALATPVGPGPSVAVTAEPRTVVPPAAVADQVAKQTGGLPRNYFVRHWRGDLSLPVAYWVNGVLLTLGLTTGIALTEDAINALPLRSVATIGLIQHLVAIATTVWMSVGIWRSADKHPSRGGSRGWAVAAQVMTAIGVLSSAGTFMTTMLPQMKEFSLVAIGRDPMAEIDAKISSDGSALILTGTFGTGSADKVRRLLEAAPGIRTVMLDSSGGRIREGEDIAALVREYELDTYVETRCESACTFVFLAGKDRAATPNARIGFHRPSFVGNDPRVEAIMLANMQAHYRAAGISQRFIDRISVTPAESMWYPTREELIANGVINRLSLGGEVSAAYASRAELERALREMPVIAEIERHFPGALGEVVNAAWEAHEGRASAADIQAAARKVVVRYMPFVMLRATDEQLHEFLKVTLDELRAARSLSDEACKRLTRAELDVSRVLGPSLVAREMQLLLDVLKGPMVKRPAVTEAELEEVLGTVFQSLPLELVVVLIDLPSYQHEPGLVCEATIAFYEAISALPPRQRSIALRGIYQEAAAH
ncbi:MAG TPA: hypothetical protein VF193_09075 [Steroidobacter sp.]